jgi:general secretion pathway protein N
MPSVRRLLIIGLITLLIGLVVKFPARVAYQWFAPPGISVNGITGTVWRGAAGHVSAQGFYIGNVVWRFKPLRLIAGKLAYGVVGRPATGFVEGDIAVSLAGNLHISDLAGTLALSELAATTQIAGLDGAASLRVENIEVSDGFPVSARGSLEVAGLMLPLVSQAPIGGYRAEFFTQEDGIVASVEDTDGAIDLAGSLKLDRDRVYQFIGQVAAKPETPQQVRDQMRFLGSPDDRGQYPIRLEGQL